MSFKTVVLNINNSRIYLNVFSSLMKETVYRILEGGGQCCLKAEGFSQKQCLQTPRLMGTETVLNRAWHGWVQTAWGVSGVPTSNTSHLWSNRTALAEKKREREKMDRDLLNHGEGSPLLFLVQKSCWLNSKSSFSNTFSEWEKVLKRNQIKGQRAIEAFRKFCIKIIS